MINKKLDKVLDEVIGVAKAAEVWISPGEPVMAIDRVKFLAAIEALKNKKRRKGRPTLPNGSYPDEE